MATDPNNEPRKVSPLAQTEEDVLAFWKEHNIFQQSLDKESPNGEFVFYDGPPFATGLPHYGSLLGSVAKDLFARYKTMQGYHVRRRWGWDTHGLPIENRVEKKLEFTDKKDIEKVGIKKFNETCASLVLEYADNWEEYVDRVGRWVEYKNAYKTMDTSFTESVWWALKEMHTKGLVYEGRKVLMYCPHCETPLAKAEIAMDNSYKDVKDISVTAKFRVKDQDNVSLLAWTTTPWTLPGNVGLAVGVDIDYVQVAHEGEEYIVAAALAEKVFADKEYTEIKTLKGSELVGWEYEPLYQVPLMQESGKKAWYVMPADFVTTEDGTGIVHTAVIYGEDDYQLGLEHDLPMVPMLDSAGKFLDIVPEFLHGVYFKDADLEVLKELKSRDLLFSKKSYVHSYPHCYRCDTPLIYNALSSWFINIQKIKDRMLELNEKIDWHPGHLKHGRFQNILETAPDWNISRNRYWASPLPFWKNTETGELTVLGSVEEVRAHTKHAGNQYWFVRHGESESNRDTFMNSDRTKVVNLTEKGQEQVREVARAIKELEPDIIIHSPFPRTTQTAEIIREETGFGGEYRSDERLRELELGTFDGVAESEFAQKRDDELHFDKPFPGGESYRDAVIRVGRLWEECEEKYAGKKILFVGHGIVSESLHVLEKGYDNSQAWERLPDMLLGNAQLKSFDLVPFPHNAQFELDLHRPYIDELEYVDADGNPMVRVPEVVDCWVESGSMPFAEYHYPFENKEAFESRFPGDYVAEYIGQVRAWFYYMLVISTALFDDAPFRNVVTTGTMLGHDSRKLSKSLGNFTDPKANFDKFGADALRFYMMASPVMAAEDMVFTDEGYEEVVKRMMNMANNVLKFYDMFAPDSFDEAARPSADHVLDRWVVAEIEQLAAIVTTELEAFNTFKAGRPIREFIAELSQWYVRRSRDRFKGEDEADKQAALATTRWVLARLATLLAPFTPFFAERLWKRTRSQSDPISVHLAQWPTPGDVDTDVLEAMALTREIVSAALEARAEAGMKVRQPLAKLEIKSQRLDDAYLEIIKDEVNVKEVVTNSELDTEVELDTEITPELALEGHARELTRNIQQYRKQSGLEPDDTLALQLFADDYGSSVWGAFADEITSATNITELDRVDAAPDDGVEVVMGEGKVVFGKR